MGTSGELSEMDDQLQSIHVRHFVIRHHQIELLRREALQCVVTVGRRYNSVTKFFQHHFASFQAIGIVVNQ